MYEKLADVVETERLKIQKRKSWLARFKNQIDNIPALTSPFLEDALIHPVVNSVPEITKIAGVDGGVISEAMSGFDIILYRAVGSVFRGIGKQVEAIYIPSFNPEPQVFFHRSLISRLEFHKITTLLRLKIEYEVALQVILQENPTVLFLDGKVSPLHSDFSDGMGQSGIISQIEQEVKDIYRLMVKTSKEKNVLLMGIVKDSRSRDLTETLKEQIPIWLRTKEFEGTEIKGWRNHLNGLLDQDFAEGLLQIHERTAWVEEIPPKWLMQSSMVIQSCLIKPIADDQPIRIEILCRQDNEQTSLITNQSINIALGALSVLCNHGLPLAIPSIILEADDRTRLSQSDLESVIDQISISLGIPKEHVRKRRSFRSSVH